MTPLSFHCTHHYSTGFALDAAFTAEEPVTALVGPSGSGKTSVLYAVAGLLRPDAGRVALGDDTWLDTARGVCLPPERRHVGVVFQDHLLFPHLSVRRNLMYGHVRRDRGTIEPARVIEVLELGELLDRAPRNLSGGEKQRVALGRALLSSPRLLLMDEPLTALDEPLRDRVLAYLEQAIAEWHVPTIYVSHSAGEVRRLAGQAIVLKAGRVVASGPPEEVLRSR